MKYVTLKKSGKTWRPANEDRLKPLIDYNSWKFPRELIPLRQWLAIRYVDVNSIKTARQALFLSIKLGKVHMAMPARGGELSALLVVQKKLTGRKVSSRRTLTNS